MSFTVLLHKQFIKKVEKLGLESAHKTRLQEVLEVIRDNPVPWKQFDVGKIKGEDDLYRVRLGRYRLFYFVDTSERTILVVDIETREKAY
jgi:mRNA interferase RelE/StbE